MTKKPILAIGILGVFLLIISLSFVSALCRGSSGYYGDCDFDYSDYYSYKPSYNLDYYPTYYRPVYSNDIFNEEENSYSYNYNRPKLFAGSYDRYTLAKLDYMNTYHGNYYDTGYNDYGYNSGYFYDGASPYYGYGNYGGYGGYYGGYGYYGYY
ncbi:MAG: hypothetical protein WC979_06815 [Candidatus Pacearchaeota archaeon]|jgi:hypothetical protein